jgi:hypothetical protein
MSYGSLILMVGSQELLHSQRVTLIHIVPKPHFSA